MSATSYQDLVFLLTGGLLALAGLTLAAWALFWDRSRGRKRCPKCWYDMSAAVATDKDGRNAFACPECGKASSAEALLNTRRRWGWAVVTLFLFALASQFPQLRYRPESGWTRFIPSTILVALAHKEDPFKPDAVMDALGRRSRELWGWQRRIVQWRDARVTSADLRAIPFTRTRWPEGEPIQIWMTKIPSNLFPNVGWAFVEMVCPAYQTLLARVDITFPLDRASHDVWGGPPRFLTLPPMPPGKRVIAVDVRYAAESGVLCNQRVEIATQVGGSATDCIEAVESDEIASLLRAHLRVEFGGENRSWHAYLDWFDEMRQYQKDGVSYFPRVELLDAGRVVARLDWEDFEDPYGAYFVRLDADGGKIIQEGEALPITAADLPMERAMVHFSESAEIAIRTSWAQKYWKGRFEVPAVEVLRPR